MRSLGTGPGVTTVALLVGAVGACGGEAVENGTADGSGPRLVAIDSVRLAEGDTTFIDSPGSLAVDPVDGSFLIPDSGGGRVLRFGRGGEFLRAYGRPGEGPGDLEVAHPAFFLDSATVAVFDHADRTLSLYDRASGTFEASHSLPVGGEAGLTLPIVTSEGVAMPTVPPDWTTGRADVESVLWWRTDGEAEFIGSMPDGFSADVAAGRWTYPNFLTVGSLALRGDLMYRGWSSMNDIWVVGFDGETEDTLRPPAIRRRGVPDDTPERFGSGELDRDGLREAISWLNQLAVLPDGSLIVTHHDRGVGEAPTTTVWVSVLDLETDRACVDALLPTSPDTYSLEAFRADTLFQLDRRIVGEDLESWIRMFELDTETCDWLPLD